MMTCVLFFMTRSCLATISWSLETSSFRGVVFVAASFRNGNGSASNSVMSSKFKNSERTSTSSLARGTVETAEAEDEGRRTTGTAAFETGNMAAIPPEVSAGTGVAGATIGTAHGTTAESPLEEVGVGRICIDAASLVDGRTVAGARCLLFQWSAESSIDNWRVIEYTTLLSSLTSAEEGRGTAEVPFKAV